MFSHVSVLSLCGHLGTLGAPAAAAAEAAAAEAATHAYTQAARVPGTHVHIGADTGQPAQQGGATLTALVQLVRPVGAPAQTTCSVLLSVWVWPECCVCAAACAYDDDE